MLIQNLLGTVNYRCSRRPYIQLMQGLLRIVPLGGLGEVGKTMMAIPHDEDIVIVDSGVMFPRVEMRGIDLVIPDTSFLIEHRSLVRGVLITHGHEDHTGALPYLLRDLEVPVYAPALAHDLITVKLREHAPLHGGDLRKVSPGDRITSVSYTHLTLPTSDLV